MILSNHSNRSVVNFLTINLEPNEKFVHLEPNDKFVHLEWKNFIVVRVEYEMAFISPITIFHLN